MPTSQAKLEANRANAQHSTGPKTPEGKRATSQNPATHAAFCRHVVLPGEDRPRFLAIRRSMLASLNPQTAAELFLADRVCSLMWRLDRLQAAEAACHLNQRTDFLDAVERDKSDFDPADLDPDLDPDLKAALDDPDAALPDAYLLALAYEREDRDNPFERLARAEQRLNGMLEHHPPSPQPTPGRPPPLPDRPRAPPRRPLPVPRPRPRARR